MLIKGIEQINHRSEIETNQLMMIKSLFNLYLIHKNNVCEDS